MKTNFFFSLALFFAVALSQPAGAQIITTVAGNGSTSSSTVVNVPATTTNIFPGCVATDRYGNFYLAEHYQVYKVNVHDTITLVAGTGAAGYSGDGGAATNATFSYISGICVDTAGNLFIADELNNVIRKVNVVGIVTTLAGTGISGYSGDGGSATAAMINSPDDVSADNAGNVYIAEVSNARIRKVNTAGIITTFAGTGIIGISGTGGPATAAKVGALRLTTDSKNNVYISEGVYVRKIDTAGIITIVAGNGVGAISGTMGNGGPATATGIHCRGITADKAGNIYFTDERFEYVHKVDTAGFLTIVAGNGYLRNIGMGFTAGGFGGDGGPATMAMLDYPCDVAVNDSGDIFICDQNNFRIRKVIAATLVASNVQHPMLQVELYPNPAAGSFTVKLPKLISAATVALTDIAGRIIEKREVDAGNERTVVFSRQLPAGVYFILVGTEAGTVSKQLVVL
ncbi:MAG: T9SS type A sorting domain-containing protein [Taibaiella sp.]|nr:T9SS type A sorting domain-containing protein [Taibaiella sp.]